MGHPTKPLKYDESNDSLVDVVSERSYTIPGSPARHSVHGIFDVEQFSSQRLSNFSQLFEPMGSPRRYSDASTFSMSFVGPGGVPYAGHLDDQDLKGIEPVLKGAQGEASPKALPPALPYLELFKYADSLDWLLMIVGTIAAVLHGLVMPGGIFLVTRFVGALGAKTFDDNAYHKAILAVQYQVYLGLQAIWLSVLEVACWTVAGDRQSGRIRALYLESLLRQEVGFYDTEMTTGEIVHQISTDSLLIHDAIGEKVATFLHNMGTFFAGIGFMFFEVWQLGLINLVFLPLTLGVAIGYTKIYTKFVARSSARFLESSSVVEQAISQVRTVYSYVAEMKAVQDFSQVLEATVKLGKSGGLAKGLGMGISTSLSNIQWGLLFWVGAVLIAGGAKIEGANILAVALTSMYTVMGLGSALREVETFANGRVAAYRIFKIIQREPLIDGGSTEGDIPQSIKGEIELSNVHFTYPSRPEFPIFKGVNLRIPAGQTVALVGSSGSGKSTVIQLIERFYDPSFGCVKLDGVDIKTLQLKWLRSHMGLVGQEPVLFATSIRQNIMHGKDGSTEEDVLSAAKSANAHSFIQDLPQQYDTQVGERGAQLSGGQKQRVAIARAVLKNPAILLLDEATSALDTESEQVVQQALNNLMHGRTTVVVAHRLSTILHSDLIAVFDRGQIVELGTHSDLLRKGNSGMYYNLVNLQATHQHKTRQPLSPAVPSSPGARRSFQLSPGSTPLRRRIVHERAYSDFSGMMSPMSGRSSPMPVPASPAMSDMLSPNAALSAPHSPLPEREPPSFVQPATSNEKQAGPHSEPKVRKIPVLEALKLLRGGALAAVVAVTSSMVAGCFNPVFSVLSVRTLFYFYGSYTLGQLKTNVAKYSLIIMGLGLSSLLASTGQHLAGCTLGYTVGKRISEKAFSAILQNEVGWFDRDENRSAMVTSRLSSNTSVVRIAVSERMVFLIQYITAIVVALAISFAFSWRVSFVSLCLVPFGIFNGAMRNAFMTTGLSGSNKEAQENSTQVAAEAVGNIRTVASLGVEDKMVSTFRSKVDDSKKHRWTKALQGGFFLGLGQCLSLCGNGLVLWYASHLLRTGQTTFKIALTVFQVMSSTSFTLIEAFKIFPDLVQAWEATLTTFDIMHRKSLIDPTSGSPSETEIAGAIQLENVTFAYPLRPDVPILQRLHLLIPANSTTALVGPSGSGKSSIVQLIERFYDPDTGRVLLDGKDIKTLNLRWLRKHIALVQQEPALFRTTILENIKYGTQNATDAEVMEAAKAANAHTFISGLPDGYDTEVGDRGAQLSGGQKQRIAIARAVLKNPKVLLLDEATSALDAESERVVQAALDRLMQGSRTTVVIAHRLSTIQNAPNIAVIEEGKVVESGTHIKLLRSRGTYAKLVQLQDLNTS